MLGISSTCWDSIAETTALAMNSSSTKALRNTCAGISEVHVFKLPVRVSAMPNDDGNGEHLELVFGNDGASGNPVKANKAYGNQP